MKLRIRVKHNEDFDEYFISGKAVYPLVWEYEILCHNIEMERIIKDANRYSGAEMIFYTVFIAFTIICCLMWVVYEAIKL